LSIVEETPAGCFEEFIDFNAGLSFFRHSLRIYLIKSRY
jgi:hypothetical protein